MSMKKILCFEKSFEVFNNISDGDFGLDVSKKLDITTAHVYDLLGIFKRAGLINKTRESRLVGCGRKEVIFLTKKGKKLQKKFEKFERSLGNGNK